MCANICVCCHGEASLILTCAVVVASMMEWVVDLAETKGTASEFPLFTIDSVMFFLGESYSFHLCRETGLIFSSVNVHFFTFIPENENYSTCQFRVVISRFLSGLFVSACIHQYRDQNVSRET